MHDLKKTQQHENENENEMKRKIHKRFIGSLTIIFP